MGMFKDIIFDKVLSPIIKAFELVPEFLMTPALNILLFGVVLSLTYQGMEVIRGAGGANPVLDVIAKNLRPLLIVTFALTVSQYKGFVTPILKEDLPNIFIGAVDQAVSRTSSSSPSDLSNNGDISAELFKRLDDNTNAQLDQIRNVADFAKDRILVPKLRWIGLSVIVDGIPALLICGLVFIVIIVTTILIALQATFIVVAWSFVMAFGPFFIALYAFEKTEKYALHWLESVLKYMFALVVLICLYSIISGQLTSSMIAFANQYLNNPTDVGAFMAKGMEPVVIAVIGAILLTKAEHLSQDLIGGGAAGSGGFAMSMGGKMAGAATGAAGAAAGAVTSAAGFAYKATKGHGQHSNPFAQMKANILQKASDRHAAKSKPNG